MKPRRKNPKRREIKCERNDEKNHKQQLYNGSAAKSMQSTSEWKFIIATASSSLLACWLVENLKATIALYYIPLLNYLFDKLQFGLLQHFACSLSNNVLTHTHEVRNRNKGMRTHQTRQQKLMNADDFLLFSIPCTHPTKSAASLHFFVRFEYTVQ